MSVFKEMSHLDALELKFAVSATDLVSSRVFMGGHSASLVFNLQ